jgi:acetyl-CoA decarbonylase/synthase complex subunit gamma
VPTAIEIYQQLPKTNCGDCGVPTCLAFAMKLAQGQASLDECPHVTDEAKAALADASAPPMATVKIGEGEKALQIGGETVLFRHDEKFHHPCGLAMTLDSSLPAEELAEKARQLGELQLERVGNLIGLDLIAVRDADEGSFAEAARTVAEAAGLPLVLMSEDAEHMKAALEQVGDGKPLIYAATSDNFEAMVELAKQHSCPLAVKAEGLAAAAELGKQATDAGVGSLVLDTQPNSLGDTVRHQTAMRRAALKQKFKPLSFPTICFAHADTTEMRVLQAVTCIAKYAGIVAVDFEDPTLMLPLITERLNIYTDPQKPPQIDQGVYEVGEPTEESPVLVTTNFSLTYYLVEGDVSATKVPTWIVVVDTEGTSVLTAWANEAFTAEIIAKVVKECGIEEKVSHRTCVIPGGVAVISGKLQEEAGWEVIVGPSESSGIPAFYNEKGFK